MLRIIYNETIIISIMANSPLMGVTYTAERVIVCTEEEAYLFFAGYAEEEIQKITDLINLQQQHPDPFEEIII